MKYLLLVFLLFGLSICEMVDWGIVFKENASISNLATTTNVSVQPIVGLKFTIDLPSQPASGYLWYLQEYDNSLLQYSETDKIGTIVASNDQIDGAPNRQIFQFFALKTGTAKLIFWNMRSWEDAPPDLVYVVNLNIVQLDQQVISSLPYDSYCFVLLVFVVIDLQSTIKDLGVPLDKLDMLNLNRQNFTEQAAIKQIPVIITTETKKVPGGGISAYFSSITNRPLCKIDTKQGSGACRVILYNSIHQPREIKQSICA
eukprot:TRINITY_DN612_c0_g1_i1.p1 TRINITY_DN612_c0_g1~~TRINITY_DN612_c0_g1_i1.p1  ORF type:complete len:294 (-),score=0.13 TRINITY_DN612_c0_g1_i1:273-1046(-)